MRRALEEKNYEIIKSIGKGAFGEVVLARNSNG
jgi:serine/threonine protein kinase